MPHPTITTWHDLVKTRNPVGLTDLLAEDAVIIWHGDGSGDPKL